MAVLLFENISGDTSETWRAQGLTEELIRQLNQTHGLRAASRSQTRRFGTGAAHDAATIARTLGAHYLVTGSLQRAGGTLRLGVELVSAPAMTSIWSERFDRPAIHLLDLQDELAAAIVREILGRTRRGRPSRDRAAVRGEAWDLFLRGNFEAAVRGAGLARAIGYYRRSIALAPAFGRAHARLAYAYTLLHAHTLTSEGLPPDSLLARARIAADQAQRLAPAESDTWLAEAYLRMQSASPRFEGVLDAFARAIHLDSGNAEAWHQYGWALKLLERDSAAIDAYRSALRLEPDRWSSRWELGQAYHLRHQLDSAVQWYDSALAIERRHFVLVLKGRALLARRDSSGARRAMAAAESQARAAGRESAPEIQLLAIAVSGDTGRFRAELEPLLANAATYHPNRNRALATAAVLLAPDTALHVLGLLPRDRIRLLEMRMPEFDVVRNDPRFRRLAAESRGEVP